MAIKKKLLIQLPKSNPYFPFSTNFKVLNFVRNDLRKDIIQYHKKLNKQGHMTIGKSSLHSKLTEFIETPLDYHQFYSLNFRSGNYDYDHIMCMLQHRPKCRKKERHVVKLLFYSNAGPKPPKISGSKAKLKKKSFKIFVY